MKKVVSFILFRTTILLIATNKAYEKWEVPWFGNTVFSRPNSTYIMSKYQKYNRIENKH